MVASRRMQEARGRVRQRKNKRANGPGQGTLIAEGDSWFNYPGTNIVSELKDLGYDVRSVASNGDTIESMAYEEEQLDDLVEELELLADKGSEPRAILISGGGNDFTGEALEVLLNYNHPDLKPLNDRIVEAVIDGRLRDAYVRLIMEITGVCEDLFSKRIPVLVHGYAHAVPDGRGFRVVFWRLRGPWLETAFDRKGHRCLRSNTDVVERLVDRFNAMLSALSKETDLEHVRYVNVRGCLKNNLDQDEYKQDWANELHPTVPGFRRIAREFHRHIK